jgi:predicted nucleic acid binding AN1-type Zn finger protein
MPHKRCHICERKLSMVEATVGACKCNGVYCNLHRLPETHSCTYDHRKDAIDKLDKQINIRVVTRKVDMI